MKTLTANKSHDAKRSVQAFLRLSTAEKLEIVKKAGVRTRRIPGASGKTRGT